MTEQHKDIDAALVDLSKLYRKMVDREEWRDLEELADILEQTLSALDDIRIARGIPMAD